MASGTCHAEHPELDLLVPGSLTSSLPLGQPFPSSPQTPVGPRSRQRCPPELRSRGSAGWGICHPLIRKAHSGRLGNGFKLNN